MISGSQRKLKINNNLAFRLIFNPKFMFLRKTGSLQLLHTLKKDFNRVEFLTQPEQRFNIQSAQQSL